MTWWRRITGGSDDASDNADARARDEADANAARVDPTSGLDRPDVLRERLAELVAFVNRSAGRLPTAAVVAARDVTDDVESVIGTSQTRDLDVYAVISINGIVGDYLPTTMRTYLALPPELVDTPGVTGRTPRQSLLEQLDALREAAEELLRAARAHDVDALSTQGSFLRTKFARSDLDL